MSQAESPKVAVIMGSQSDWPTMKHAADTLAELGIPHRPLIISAHRTPDQECPR
jgi:5-(carboxyamino)imidazole ribonucleotide mutase